MLCSSSIDGASTVGEKRSGLTLLELLVVLGILAVLSTIAVTSLDPIADQSRFEATQRLLDSVRLATVGDPALRQIQGQRIITGYVTDTGMLPSDVTDLVTQPVGLVAHSVVTFDSDRDSVDDVTLSSGWRGPYMRLGAGQRDVLDGWGRAPIFAIDGGELTITSTGSDADSVAPEEGYRADLSVSVAARDYVGSVTFRLYRIDSETGERTDPAPVGNQRLGVMLYAVNAAGGTTGAIEERTLAVASSGSFETARTELIHGMAAARGVHWNDNDGDSHFDAGEMLRFSSDVHYFLVTEGTDTRIELELR